MSAAASLQWLRRLPVPAGGADVPGPKVQIQQVSEPRPGGAMMPATGGFQTAILGCRVATDCSDTCRADAAEPSAQI
jgi:hypothetical protein